MVVEYSITSPLRVLYVTGYYKPAYVYGGPVRSISSLCEAMARQGAELTVYTTNSNRKLDLGVTLNQPIDVDGVQVVYYPLSQGGLRYFYSKELAYAIRRSVQNFDIVIAEILWGQASIVVKKACFQSHVPYIVPLRGQLLPTSLAQKHLKKQIYLWLLGNDFLNKAVALQATDEIESTTAKKLGLKPPIFIVPNGLNTARFASLPERGHFRYTFGIPLDSPVILYLGRLHPYKRPDIVIQAAYLAQRRLGKAIHIIIAGPDEGGMSAGLMELAEELGFDKNVHLTGLLKSDEILQAFSDADLLMMPTEIQENFGMSALEALAAGIPVLVSDKIPVGRWATQAGAGISVPCDVNKFCDAIFVLFSDPAQLQQMGERGKELVKQKFEISIVASDMLAQYRSIISTGRPIIN